MKARVFQRLLSLLRSSSVDSSAGSCASDLGLEGSSILLVLAADGLQAIDHRAGNLVDAVLVLAKERLNSIVEDVDSTASLRGEAPYEEGKLDTVVERNPVEEKVSERLNDDEESVHNPVGEPLSVVLLVLGLDSLERAVSGVDETNEVAEWGYGTGSRGQRLTVRDRFASSVRPTRRDVQARPPRYQLQVREWASMQRGWDNYLRNHTTRYVPDSVCTNAEQGKENECDCKADGDVGRAQASLLHLNKHGRVAHAAIKIITEGVELLQKCLNINRHGRVL